MKTFKKLLLSATTIFALSGTIEPANAFVFLTSNNETPQQPAISTTIQAFNLGKNKLQTLDNGSNGNHSDDIAFLMPHLKEIVSIQTQDANTLEAKQKERAQLLDYILQYREIRKNQQANALQQMPDNNHHLKEEIAALREEIKQLRAHALAAPQEPHVRMQREEGDNALSDDIVIMPRKELEVMTAQIKSLTEQITQLQESHLNLNSSISLLHTSYEERRNQVPFLHSSALSPSYTSTPTGKDENHQEKGLSDELNSPPSSTETPTPTEDDKETFPKSLATAVATLPTIGATLESLSGLANERTDVGSVSNPIKWVREEFVQAVLGKRPDDLTSLTTVEIDLWRTFTLLAFKGTDEVKPWSTWGGAFTTEELEEKFKSNGFMTRAFQIKKAIASGEYSSDTSSDDIFTYFTSNKPEIKPETEKDLIKAYYFRGLLNVLTGRNFQGRNGDSTAAEFRIDLHGLKNSNFNYGSNVLRGASYETSICEAEEFFENTPWHHLFINQVQQATLNKLAKQKDTLQKEYWANLKTIENQKGEDDDSDKQTSRINFKSQYETTAELLDRMQKAVLKATSLREIDDALELRS